MYKYLKLNSYIIESLKNVEIPIESIDDITGLESESISVFSDYGADNADYDTYGFYITDWNNSGFLRDELHKIKKKYNIEDRTISYKGRKDNLKRKAFVEWINVVRNYPGLIYVIAFDNRFEKLPEIREERNKLKKELEKKGFPENKVDIYFRMIKAISFLIIIGPYLKEKHKLAWISDPDKILDTEERKEILSSSFGFLADDILEENISAIGFNTFFEGEDDKTKDINNLYKELLSIADVAASTLSASFHHNEDQRIGCPDVETCEMFEELSKFCDIENYKIENELYCALGISVFDLKFTEDEEPYLHHYKLKTDYDKSKRSF